MHINRIILLGTFITLPFIFNGCHNGDKASSAAANSALQRCLGNTPLTHAEFTFYSEDASAVYQRILKNEKFSQVRATNMWQDIALGFKLTPEYIGRELKQKAKIPFGDKIVEELLKGEICGAFDFNDGQDVWSSNDAYIENLKHKDFVIVKPLKGSHGWAPELIKIWRELAGNNGDINSIGNFKYYVGEDYLLLGTHNMVKAAKEMVKTPREINVNQFFQKSDKILVANFNVNNFMDKLNGTVRPLFLEPISNISFALSSNESKELGKIQIVSKNKYYHGTKEQLSVNLIPVSSRAMLSTTGWNVGALWGQLLAKRSYNNVSNSNVQNLFDNCNGQVSWFFDGFLNEIKADSPEISSSMVLAFGLKDGVDINKLSENIKQLEFDVINGNLKDVTPVESPAKKLVCSDYRNFADSDVRCFAITDKMILIGYQKAVRQALATLRGQQANIGKLENTPQSVNDKHSLISVVNMAHVAADFNKMAPEDAKDLVAPFAKSLGDIGIMEVVMDGNSDTMNGEIYGF